MSYKKRKHHTKEKGNDSRRLFPKDLSRERSRQKYERVPGEREKQGDARALESDLPKTKKAVTARRGIKDRKLHLFLGLGT